MNKNYPINLSDIWQNTEGGRFVIEDIFPESKMGFTYKKNFRIRHDDKIASCCVFKDPSNTFYFLQDKGGKDTKAKNAIEIVQEQLNMSFYDAIQYVAKNYCNDIKSNTSVRFIQNEPVIQQTNSKYERITPGKEKELTEYELSILGPDIKPEHCKKLNLKSLESYYTKSKEGKNSLEIKSTDKYPILYYDYGTFGKIYQPLSKEYRFIYTGEKPSNHIFCDNDTAALINKVKKGEQIADTNEEQADSSQIKFKKLIICSGPSDALNVYAQGFNVIWLNSETAKFTTYEYESLRKITDEIYLLPDIDETGIREAYKIAVKFLDIKIIWLPPDLKNFKDWKGKQCKDARDYFKYYKQSQHTKNSYYFKQLVNSALPLRFWNEIIEYDRNGNPKPYKRYEINNEQCYRFLNALGLYTLNTKLSKAKREYSFIHIDSNTRIVRYIQDENLCKYVNDMLSSYIRKNLEYYNISLLNTIHRSRQLTFASLSNIERVNIDFKSFSKTHDAFFFKNYVVNVTAKDIELIKYTENENFVWDFKIIEHSFTKNEPLFSVEYSQKYRNLQDKIISCSDVSQLNELRDEINNMPDLEKYELIINSDFSFLKYLYNTGRVYWKKEEIENQPLTEEEKKVQDLHFISKVVALGYAMFRYKMPGLAYALYAMETEQGDIGQHKGGTGKSIFYYALEKVRNLVFMDGMKNDFKNDIHLFSLVVKDVTDFIYFDDLNEYVDLHLFMPAVTGKLTVKNLFKDKYVIDFDESPKIGISSNHAVRNIDPSIRRRLWFLGFSNYYHPENKAKQITERTPLTEFGINLIDDYDQGQMNTFYNFMLQCLQTFLKFKIKIEPDLADIEKRNIQNSIGDEFLCWADDYFTEDKLNINIEKQIALEDWKTYLPENERKKVSSRKFKQQIMCFAEYKKYVFNPEDLLQSPTERDRNQIKGYNSENKQVEYFHLRTTVTSDGGQ